MTSIIKVDTIQTSAGGTPTASSLGIGGTGKIGQVIYSTYSTSTSTTSKTFADTGHSASITPSATSSKVLVLLTYKFGVYRPNNGGKDAGYAVKILRDSTAVVTYDQNGTGAYYDLRDNAVAQDQRMVNTISYIDSPSSTSSLTYKIQHATYQDAGCTGYYANANDACILTLMEVLA